MAEKSVVIITGASSGIGQNIAIELSRRGYAVVLCGRNKEGLETTSKQCQENGTAPEEILQILGDLANPLEPERIVSDTVNKFGRITALINNAGCVKWPDTLEIVTAEYFDWVFSVNLRAPVLLTKACMPYLEKSKGVVINISSVMSLKPSDPTTLVYSMTKSAMNHFTESIACAYGPKGVRVCGILPGYIPTQMAARAMRETVPEAVQAEVIEKFVNSQPVKRIGKVEDVSKAVAYLLSEEASFITGENLLVDGGFRL